MENKFSFDFSGQMCLDYFNLQPSSVKGTANTATWRNKRYLYNKLFSVYDFTLPKQWALNWFRFWIFQYGSIAAIYTKEYGWVILPYGISGLDMQYNPSKIECSNHMFKDVKKGIIGVNAEIIKIRDDYFGVDDLVTEYAETLAQVEKSYKINLMNSNVALWFPAENKKDADAVKEAYEEATTGKPFVTLNKKVMSEPLQPMIRDIKANYIVGELLEARRNVVNQFLTDVGIRNFNMEKKAQQNKAEITENNGETEALAYTFYRNLKDCFARLNAISGLGCDVKLHYDYKGGGVKWEE